MSRALDLHTNRDLYLFVTGLSAPDSGRARSLEEYLRALWRLGAARRELAAVPLPAFASMLEAALHEPPPAFDPRWPEEYDEARDERIGFARWEATIRAQVVDLHEMAEAGALADEQRYFGIDAPRGGRWYNFDPRAFLECAVEGSFGGWCEGDAGGRCYVPGPCVALDEDGKLITVDPREIKSRLVELDVISWEDFAGFLRSGQWYE